MVVVGQPRAMLLLFKQAMDRKWEMLLCLDSEKQHKGANVEGYINRRLVQWLVCGRSVALLMPCICISLCHSMQRHWYVEREQWGLRRPPGGSPSFARTHGMTDASET